MKKIPNKDLICGGCKHFFVTYDMHKPWGCHHFGFKSKKLPAMLVIETSGTKCAYRKEITYKGRQKELD